MPISEDITTYLATQGMGTVGTDIFYEYQPENPAACITVFDAGGPSPEEPPESWRELYVQVRSPDHATGYANIWAALSSILYPTTPDGTFAVGENQYIAQLQDIPSITARDELGRYLFFFRAVVVNLAGNAQADDWLTALANWTTAALPGWMIYSGWRGFKRPSVTWMLTGTQTKERGGSSYLLQKKLTGFLLGRTPNEHAQAAATLITGLACAIKIPLDPTSNTWLTVITPAASADGQSNLLSKATVTLQRVTLRPPIAGALTGTLMDTVTLTKEEIKT
jgi:hypothetical protein